MAQKSDFLPLQLAQLLHLVSILQTSHRAMIDNKIEKQCNNIGKSTAYAIFLHRVPTTKVKQSLLQGLNEMKWALKVSTMGGLVT